MCVGLEASGNYVGVPVNFTIDAFSAGRGDVEVVIKNSAGIKEQVRNLDFFLV